MDPIASTAKIWVHKNEFTQMMLKANLGLLKMSNLYIRFDIYNVPKILHILAGMF